MAANVRNKTKLDSVFVDDVMANLRKDIYHHLIYNVRRDENNYFDIEGWARSHSLSNSNSVIAQCVKDISVELEALGWKCKTSFGSTGLFIYSTEKPPSLCFEDGL